MKNKKIKKALAFTVLCILVGIFLHGRMRVEYKAMENEQGQDHEEGVEFPKTYQKNVSDKLKFDVEVVLEEGFQAEELHAATASLQLMNHKDIYQYFIGDNASVKKEIHEGYYDYEGEDDILTIYEDEVGNSLQLTEKDFSYSKDPLASYINNSFYFDSISGSYGEVPYSKTSDLSFMDRTAAWEKLTGIMEKIGIDMSTAVKKEVYSLDMKTLQSEERCIDVDGNVVEEEKNPNWSKADEGYYYYIEQQFQGLPLYGIEKVGMWLDERIMSSMCGYQTAGGICDISIDHWFSFLEQEEKLKLASFEKIMCAVENKYSGTVGTTPLKVEKAKLYEYPLYSGESTYTLIPIWVITITQELEDLEGQPYESHIQMPVNAVTGEEMPELEDEG